MLRGKLGILAFLAFLCVNVHAADTKIGVFYFPGWRDYTPHAPSDLPWEPIKRFPEREPLLGWYDEGKDHIMQSHMDWMIEAGINYVVFDWYWDVDNRVYLDHALGAYFRNKSKNKLPFSIMWANHVKAPTDYENWTRMIDFWLKFYTHRPEMLRIDGKPVVFIFLSRVLEENARKFGSSTKELLSIAQERAQKRGLDGLYFVAGATGEELDSINRFPSDGYSAVSMYNMHRAPFVAKQSHSFKELDEAYRLHWASYEKNSKLPIFFPITSGWDKRAWGGTTDDPKHDLSMSTPYEFKSHLQAAKSTIEAGKLRPGQATRWGLICCWNEFGEGSYIEPTKFQGKQMIEQVRKVFKAPNSQTE